jgi:hypothetical protein
MKKIIFIAFLLFSVSSFSQKERSWDVRISAIDSTTFSAVPNVNLYFSIKDKGDWEINTGIHSRAIMSDFFPEEFITFPCEIYLGFEPPKSSSTFLKVESPKKGMVPIEISISEEEVTVAYDQSVSFEKDGLLFTNTEDVMDISYHLRKDSGNFVILSFTQNEIAQKNSAELGQRRISALKKEIEKLSPNQSERIRVKINETKEGYHIRDKVGVQLATANRDPYLPSIHSVEYYYKPQFRFQPNSDQLENEAKISLAGLPEFLIANPKLAIEFKLYHSEGVSKELAKKRYRAIQRHFINRGIDHFRLISKMQPFFTKEELDSLETKNGFRNNENDAYFHILEDDISPCTPPGQPKMHFKKFSQDIFETQCDSIGHLVRLIESYDEDKFVLIGIATDKSQEEIFNAKSRAEVVKKKLIEKGIDASRLSVMYNVFKPQAEGKYEVWPFYPEWFEYEIGVYIEIDN